MGIACSKEGASLVSLPSALKPSAYQRVYKVDSKEDVIEWMRELHMQWKGGSYPIYFHETKRYVFMILPLNKNPLVCGTLQQNPNTQETLLYLHENVCVNRVGLGYMIDILNDSYVALMVVKDDSASSVAQGKKSATCVYPSGITKTGISLAFFNTIPFEEFKETYAVDDEFARAPDSDDPETLPSIVSSVKPEIKNVCCIKLLCSNQNGGGALLDYIEKCFPRITSLGTNIQRFDIDMMALESVPSAYTYYLKNGFRRSNDQHRFFPIWKRKGDDEDIYFYTPEEMESPPHNITLESLKKIADTRPFKLTLTQLEVFREEGWANGYLLTRLTKYPTSTSKSAVAS